MLPPTSPLFAARRLRRLAVPGLCALFLGYHLHGAGISTHFEAADRSVGLLNAAAYPDLERILKTYPVEYRVGAIYPDWGYLLAETAAAAEAAHWPPFHTAALEYLHDAYGEPWGAHQERLFAFLCGLSCHGAVDDPWHFGPNAFLTQAIAHDRPPGDPALAVEALTDMFVQVEKRRGREDLDWWIPVADLVEISRLAGYPEVTAEAVVLGTGIQQVGAFLEDRFAVLLYYPARWLLPWTRRNYWTWPDGGVLDGAEFTARTLENYWDEYQSIAAGGDGGRPRGGGHAHLSPGRVGPFLRLAEEVIRDRVVEVRSRPGARGAVSFQEPLVNDPGELLRRLQRLLD